MALKQLLGKLDRITDSTGRPVQGGLVDIYEPNTTTRITSYKDSGLTVENTNPVRLDAMGQASIWISRNADVRVTDADSNLIAEELSANPDQLGSGTDSGLVPNGSFELDTDADTTPDGWGITSQAGATNAIDSTAASDGGQSYKFISAGNGGGELKTTDFFAVNDAEDLRVSFDILSSVANMHNIVRVEWYDVSQVAISNTDVYNNSASNPTVFTSQDLLASPPANSRFAKLVIIGGDSTSAVSGSTNYDRVRVFYPQVVSGVFDNITIQNNDLISTNTNGDINLTPNGTGRVVPKNLSIKGTVAAATPPTTEAVDTRLVLYDSDLSDVLGEFGYFGDNNLALFNRMHGGLVSFAGECTDASAVNLVTGEPGADTASSVAWLWANNGRKIGSRLDGAIVRGELTAADGAVHNTNIEFQNNPGTLNLGTVGFDGSADFVVRSNNLSDSVRIQGKESGSSIVDMVVGDPNGILGLYHGGLLAAETAADGFAIRDTSGTTTTLSMFTSAGTQQAILQAFSGNVVLRSLINSEVMSLQGTNSGGNTRTMLQCNPDGIVQLYHPGSNTAMAETAAAASGGFLVNNTVTGGGFERALTTSDLTATLNKAVKTSNTSISSDATLTVDSDFTVSLLANKIYAIEMLINYTTLGAGGIQIRTNYSGTVGNTPTHSIDDNGNVEYSGINGIHSYPGANASGGIILHACIETTSAGDYTLSWAQDTSNATQLTVASSSYTIATLLN